MLHIPEGSAISRKGDWYQLLTSGAWEYKTHRKVRLCCNAMRISISRIYNEASFQRSIQTKGHQKRCRMVAVLDCMRAWREVLVQLLLFPQLRSNHLEVCSAVNCSAPSQAVRQAERGQTCSHTISLLRGTFYQEGLQEKNVYMYLSAGEFQPAEIKHSLKKQTLVLFLTFGKSRIRAYVNEKATVSLNRQYPNCLCAFLIVLDDRMQSHKYAYML